MATLADRECVPCKGGTPALKGQALADLAGQLDGGWRVVAEHHIEKEYPLKNFREALDLANRIGELAEAQGHHPDLYVAWGRVKVHLDPQSGRPDRKRFRPRRQGGRAPVSHAKALSPLAVVGREGEFCGGEFKRALLKGRVRGELDPLDRRVERRGSAHGVMPIGPGQANRGRLDGTLDEETVPGATLRRPRYLAPPPKQVRLFVTDEALAGLRLAAARGQFRGDTQAGEGRLEPGMRATVALGGAERIPGMVGGKDKAVSPVGIMRDDAPRGGAAYQGAQGRERLDLGVALEIAERGGGLGPTVKAQDRAAQEWRRLEQCLIEGHIEGRGARA